jgi:hypothetical protein
MACAFTKNLVLIKKNHMSICTQKSWNNMRIWSQFDLAKMKQKRQGNNEKSTKGMRRFCTHRRMRRDTRQKGTEIGRSLVCELFGNKGKRSIKFAFNKTLNAKAIWIVKAEQMDKFVDEGGIPSECNVR